MVQDFRKLEVWQVAHAATLEVCKVTMTFPSSERYGLTSQLRRAAASIGANLAEGCGRGRDADFRRFVQIAMGSASELEYHVLLAQDLKFIPADEAKKLNQQIGSVKRMLTAFLKRLSPNSYSGRQPTAESRQPK